MTLIKARPNRGKSVRYHCFLEEANYETLFLYRRFMRQPASYVINQLIVSTLARDREFVAWRAQQPNLPCAGSSSTDSSSVSS